MLLLKNNAYSTLAGALTNVATTMSVAVGTGNRFDAVTAPDFFYMTLQDAANNIEIVKVTARTAGADSMSIERAQDGTTARAWNIGDVCEVRLPRAVVAPLQVMEGASTAADIRTKLGATGVGSGLFTAVDAPAQRALLGGTPTGSAVFTAGDAAAARTAIGALGAADTIANATNLTGSGTISDNSTINTQKVGYRDIPPNSVSANYTFALGDEGEQIFHPAADTTARTWTIPANASVAFRVGTAITLVNENGAGAITLAITTDTLYQPGTGATGSRTLASGGMATLLKVTATKWYVSGAGLT